MVDRIRYTSILGNALIVEINLAVSINGYVLKQSISLDCVVDAFCGANKDTRMAIRFIVEVAWQAHFVTNMFIKPTEEELKNFEPDFVVYNASKAKVENYKELGLNSETCVAFNITSREQVIVNTWYGGEMKKGMFSMMNYYLPLKGIASMHCSANTDMNGENTAIFFGLSGTGKTTLSTDPKRLLIGDDEHGWDDNGVFNFEGGCYAKVINLDKDSEPDIYNAIKRNALLENVTLDAEGKIDFADKSVTENTRVSYPINHIEKIVRPISSAPAAKNVIFLSADAFGVLPPVSILTPEQTQYYFLSGFTAKLAGTERGITEPTPTFSACFGQAFLELHPTKYAEELVKKMEKSGAKAYLVNTGWNGTGKRISIKDTRMAIRFIVEVAWQAHFVTNMFIQPTEEELENFEPDFVVYNASKAKVENYKELGLNSETAVLFNITSKEQVIVNTWYGGEMKKGMLSLIHI